MAVIKAAYPYYYIITSRRRTWKTVVNPWQGMFEEYEYRLVSVQEAGLIASTKGFLALCGHGSGQLSCSPRRASSEWRPGTSSGRCQKFGLACRGGIRRCRRISVLWASGQPPGVGIDGGGVPSIRSFSPISCAATRNCRAKTPPPEELEMCAA